METSGKMTDREACILFNMISGIGYVKYRALVDAFGTPAAALAQPVERLLTVPGIGPQLAERVAKAPEEIDLAAELAFAERGAVRILTLLDEAYPKVLREIYDPPLVLYIRGTLPEFGRGNALAVVGTRRMSRYGEEMTRRITGDAVAAGMVTVSGLANGVDTVAHRVTVENRGVTVAVLGGGLARLQPQENVPLAREIITTGGAVITEFPMNFPVSRTSFPRRNRIVAALADAVLVAEAGLESGALITANLAADRKLVMAVPGRVDNPQSRGCHELIKNGATLVESFADVAQAMGFGLLPLGEVREEEVKYDPGAVTDLSNEARRILALLEEGEKSFDELATASLLEAGVMSSILMQLELKMLIRRSADQLYGRR